MVDYLNFYSSTQRQGVLNRTNSIADFLLEKKLSKLNINSNFHPITLELGATEGQHLKFVNLADHKMYIGVDLELRGPQKSSNSSVKHLIDKNNNFYFTGGNIESLPFKNESLDQIISLCIFHHLVNPERAMAEILRTLKPGGLLVVQLPTDPGFLNHALKNLILYRSISNASKVNPKLYYARSHRNHIWSLLQLFKFHFEGWGKLKFHYWPFYFKSWNFNLIVFVTFRKS
jgi:SAM-dependent methyltransferase